MTTYFIDSHAHLTCDDATYSQIDAILTRADVANVKKIINICTTVESLDKGLLLQKQYPWIYNSAAITPHDVGKIGDEGLLKFAKHAKDNKLIAIGETGLDYYYTHSDKEIQKKHLRSYLHLALDCNLPVIIHCREAFQDFFDILDQEYTSNQKTAPGVLHCFTGTLQEAEDVINRGFYLSLSGIVTFKKSIQLQEVAKFVPLQQLLIETDTPFLAPQTRRGKPNEPAYLPETASFIANLKNISLNELRDATANNAARLFKLKEIQ
jgi:TatD DNase family protein